MKLAIWKPKDEMSDLIEVFITDGGYLGITPDPDRAGKPVALDLQDAYDLADWIVGKRKETGARKE